MKKVICFISALTLVSQLAFTVAAADAKLVSSIDISSLNAGEALVTGAFNAGTPTGTVNIAVDEDGEKYIEVRDRDSMAEVGIERVCNTGDIATVSYDYMLLSNSPSVGKFYVGGANGWSVSISLYPVPAHWNGNASVSIPASLKAGEWRNLTCIIDKKEGCFDFYQDGNLVGDDIAFRGNYKFEGDLTLRIMGDGAAETNFNLKNVQIYDGEKIPEKKIIPDIAERRLVDYVNAPQRLDEALGNSVAMSIGNSMARVNNGYVNIYPGEPYVTPFISDDGSTLIPARFATEAIGCEVEVVSLTRFKIHKDGTTIEFNTGDKNAIINGQIVEMPTAPVIKLDRLFVPLRFAAETFGKTVFWDDRGLIVISDGKVINPGQEDLIKPLLSQIRNYTTMFGNKKYSDVNFSSRGYRGDGWNGEQWSTLDATKRFMATIDRWIYISNDHTFDAMKDQGVLLQGTLNANVRDDPKVAGAVTTYFIDGTPWMRSDGANGTTWGCVNNPVYKENIYNRAKWGIDGGLFLWQFDDWAINTGYGPACFCDYCMKDFTSYLLGGNVSREQLDKAGYPEITEDFNFKTWLKDEKGISTISGYNTVSTTPLMEVWDTYKRHIVKRFHRDLLDYMEKEAGEEIFYQINEMNTFSHLPRPNDAWFLNEASGTQGETDGGQTAPPSIYGTMLFTRALGLENILSPLPKSQTDKDLMYSAIPMCYATGQHMLIPWDTWLYGSTRYFATLDELQGLFELPREYPYLFDNYEMPEKIGYIFDLSTIDNSLAESSRLLKASVPAKALVRLTGIDSDTSLTFRPDNFKNIQALVATSELKHLTDEERKMIEDSGLPVIDATNTDAIKDLEESLWTVRVADGTQDVYPILRENKLYDNAPVVIHAVNYNTTEVSDVEIEINNMYLPEGDELIVNIYKPWTNNYKTTVKKGNGVTRFNIDSIDKWTILEISGPGTVRREANFAIGEGYNGIGMGTRLSNDKAVGTTKDFTIITYSEGINSTTAHDSYGSQDEAAFIYKRVKSGAIKETVVNANFEASEGVYGVMAREGIYSNARFVALMYDEANGLRLAQRKETNGAVEYTHISNDKPDNMQLVRKVGKFEARISENGSSFTSVGSLEAKYPDPVVGVFASSPDGSRSACRVKDMWVSEGNYPSGENFEGFNISCGNGTIENVDSYKLDVDITTNNHTHLSISDVDVSFKSSDENILRITSDGTVVPVNEGKAVITATATMGLRRITDTLHMTVVPANKTMYSQTFDAKELPSGITKSASGNVEVKDGALRLTSDKTGDESNAYWSFAQRNKPTVMEFDFKAHYGTQSPTTGARLVYAHGGSGVCLTADPGTLNWFYGSTQTKVANMEPDVWHHIKLEINYDEQWCNVYLDGTKVVDKGEPRGAISANGTMNVGGWRLGTDTVYEWDNFNIYFVEAFE